VVDSIQGKRRDLNDGEMFEPGEYGRYAGQWMGIPPGTDMLIGLRNHSVVEHEDGTITVSPSILVGVADTSNRWHGYLERGVWREV
jgi:hypothetical protein